MDRSPTRPSGRHGIGPRRPAPAPASPPDSEPAAASVSPIVDRPPPVRTHPRRDATTLGRGEGGTDPFHLKASVHPAPVPDVGTPMGVATSVVPEAYRIIDQYVEDGQKAAQNWTHAGEGKPREANEPTPASPEAHEGPAADHLITEAISALVSTRGLNSAASALPAILAGLAPGAAVPNALEVLIDAAEFVLDGRAGRGPKRRGRRGRGAEGAHPELASLWEELGASLPVDDQPDHPAPMSTTGWLPDSHED